MTNLVLQSFGNETEYRRAIITVLSFYTYCTLSEDQTKVLLFTDQPDYFKNYFSGLPVEYILLTSKKVEEMRGRINFLHRIKIAIIEEAFSKTNGNILYADSDTFFIADPAQYLNQLSPFKSFMHLQEYRFEELRHFSLPMGTTFHAFLSLIETTTFHDAKGGELKIHPHEISWNAGVMLFHPSHAQFIPDVYVLTEQFYPTTLNHACEQYAFSIILQRNTEIRPCDKIVCHYWYRVKKQIIDDFLKRHLPEPRENLALAPMLTKVKEWTQSLPALFEKHVWMTRDRAIQAFTSDNFSEGYRWAAKALLQSPFSDGGKFIKDTLHHLKRQLTHK